MAMSVGIVTRCRWRHAESHVEVGLGEQGVGVGIESHQVAHVCLLGAEDAIVQGDEVVAVLMMDDVVDEAVINRDVSMNDAASIGLVEIHLEVSNPNHATKVIKGIVDVEIHSCVDKDIVFKLMIVFEPLHPFDVLLGYFTGMLDAKALERGGSTHFFPGPLDLGLEEMPFLVGFPSLDAIVFVVAFEAMKSISL